MRLLSLSSEAVGLTRSAYLVQNTCARGCAEVTDDDFRPLRSYRDTNHRVSFIFGFRFTIAMRTHPVQFFVSRAAFRSRVKTLAPQGIVGILIIKGPFCLCSSASIAMVMISNRFFTHPRFFPPYEKLRHTFLPRLSFGTTIHNLCVVIL